MWSGLRDGRWESVRGLLGGLGGRGRGGSGGGLGGSWFLNLGGFWGRWLGRVLDELMAWLFIDR